MASLYSAQVVINAREQLQHELQEKAHSDYSIQDSSHKTEKHHANPYHYHETVHEKCKHHGEEKESTLHKKLHQKIEQGKPREEHESEHGHRASSGRSMRRIMNEREEVQEEMKEWAKTIEKCLKGDHKLTEKELHEQHAGFYKWMLFIEELFRNYESSLKTQTSLHALDQEDHRSDKSLEESQGILCSPKPEHKSKEVVHGIKLPQIMTRERMDALQARVNQLEKQLEVSEAHNRQISKRVKELTSTIAESEEKTRIRSEKTKKIELNIKSLLSEMEQFNSNLLSDLKQSEKLKAYPKMIETNMGRIRQLRKSLESGGE